jgi:radical SAM superfamily enzyme YgiQ (UPF0313 family)
MTENLFGIDEDYLKGITNSPSSLDPQKPRFILVVPPSPQIPTPGREFFLKTPIEGVSYIATTLKNAGYEVEIVDYRTIEEPFDEVKIDDRNIIGITTFADSFVFLEDLTRKIKEKNRKAKIVLGGPFVSSAPEVLLMSVEADYAVLGEGELTILELMAALSKGDDKAIPFISGLGYKKNGEIHFTKPRQQLVNLDNLPFLDLSLWPAVRKESSIERIGLSSSRGCYNKCSFCFKTIPLVRQMDPAKFGSELKDFVKKYGLKFAYINDLTFVISRERTVDICRELKKSGIHWACSTRVQDIDKDLLRVMKDSGCEEIWYGIESVDQKVLDTNFKNIKVEEIENVVKITNEIGIKVMANFIIGLLGETDQSLNKMIEFIETRDVIPCSIKYLTPFPGTYIYQYARQKGLIRDEVGYFRSLSRRKVNYVDDEIVNCTELPEEKLRRAFKKIREISYERYRPLDWDLG